MKMADHKIRKSEQGFTLTELMVVVVLSAVVLAAMWTFFSTQAKTFSLQNQLLKMQANGRAGLDFISRSIHNTGYNMVRGRRFLAASDRYLTVVYDEDDDSVIQNDEVITYAVSNPSGSSTETFTISPFFDQNGDNIVESDEPYDDYDIPLILSGPPYHLYKFVPNKDDDGYTRTAVAQYLDNVIFRYYNQNNDPLPATVDGMGNRIPPTLPYDFSGDPSELNDIRQIEIEIMTRTKNPDPRTGYTSSGTYPPNSVATYDSSGNAGSNPSYSDSYHRKVLTASVSPRNLIVSPWGKISITSNPNPVLCPNNVSTITATLVDASGQSLSGVSIDFNASDGTLSPSSSTTDSDGNASTSLSYGWSSPNESITFSASAVVDIDGENKTIYNAVPVYFQTGTGVFSDDFNDGDSNGWVEGGAGSWNVPSDEYRFAGGSDGFSVNGCDVWQDYKMEVDARHVGWAANDYLGVFLRYQDPGNNYVVRVRNTGVDLRLEIVKNIGGVESILSSIGGITFPSSTDYRIKASIVGNTIQAEIWDLTPPPPGWMISATDTDLTNGMIGLTTNKTTFFDDVFVTPN